MTTQTEALKLALEALERGETELRWKAITAIKEALAQQELCKYGQEPKLCTSSPMDCQCAIDATLAQPEQEPNSTTSMSPTSPKALQPEQEPVALETVYETIIQWDEGGGKRSRRELARRIVSLYTAPPQRTWVGLTEKDMDWLHENTPCIEGNYGYRFIKAIEAKLKEKNT